MDIRSFLLRHARTAASVLAAAVLLLAPGCSENPVAVQDEALRQERAAVAARQVAGAVRLVVMGSSLAQRNTDRAAAGKHGPALGDTLGTGCPTVTVAPAFGGLGIVLDFGSAGCTAEDGAFHQGRIIAGWRARSIQVAFDQYRNRDGALDGRIGLTARAAGALRLLMADLRVTGEDGAVTLGADLVYTPVFGEGAFRLDVTGTGSVRDERGGGTVAFEIVDALTYLAGCRHPAQGIVQVRFTQPGADPVDARVDFGPGGGCDGALVVHANGPAATQAADR